MIFFRILQLIPKLEEVLRNKLERRSVAKQIEVKKCCETNWSEEVLRNKLE